MNTKFILAEKSETVDVERSVVGWGSKPTADRDGELIEASAWDLDNYRKNPVLCLSHDLSKPPIGKILWVKADANGLKFKAQFAGTERGKEAYQLYKEGVMTSFSVGFRPKPGGFVDNPTEERYKGLKRVFKSVELFEISCVTVPSLPSAVAEYVKSGKVQNIELKGELEDIIANAPIVDLTGEPNEGREESTEDIIEDNKDTDVTEKKEETDEGKVTVVNVSNVESIDAKSFEEAVKKIKELEASIKALSEKEEKTLDFGTKQPSVYDVMSALNNMLSSNTNSSDGLEAAEPRTRSYRSIIDIYPIEYPNGIVVYRIYGGNGNTMPITYRQGYVYDAITKKATLNDDAIPVEEAWVEKRYDAETLEALDDVETTKSTMDVRTLEELSDHLSDVLDLIQRSMDSSLAVKKADMDDEDDELKGLNGDDIIELEDEVIEKSADSHVEDEQHNEEEIDLRDLDAKELSDLITKTVDVTMKTFNSTVKDRTVEETNKLMGKATM